MTTVPIEFQAAEIDQQFEAVGSALELLDEVLPVQASPVPAPAQLLLGALRDGRLRVRSPIAVELTTENQDFIAEAVGLDEFGFGKNPSEAVADLQHAIAELYFTLDREQGRLGPDLMGIWSTLQQNVERLQ